MSATRRGLSGYMLAGAVLVLAVIGGTVWLTGHGGTPGIGGPFALVGGEGRTVTDEDFRGRFMLVYFGYTFCPDVCPTTLNQVADALDKLGPKAGRLQPIFITVDPERDNPAAVEQFAAAFSPKLIGLTGSAEQIAKVAREYRVYYAVHRTGNGANDYTVDHSSILYLMDPEGRFVAPIRADQSGADMAVEIARYLS